LSPRRARAIAAQPGVDPAAALREHLIACAAAALGQTPATTVTTRAIARRAGVSDGVLYNHFRNRHDLLLAALMRLHAEIATEYATATATIGSDVDPIVQTLERLTDAQVRYQSGLLPLLLGLIPEPELLRRFFVAIHHDPAGPGRVRLALVEQIATAQRAGAADPDADASTVATLVMGAALQLAFAQRLGPLTQPPDRNAPASEASLIAKVLARGIHPA
jgi:AcrR family transcriptional regulator